MGLAEETRTVFILTCDRCDEPDKYDEITLFHESAADAESSARDADWERQEDGSWLCGSCVEERDLDAEKERT